MCSHGYKVWSVSELKSETCVPELLGMSADEKRKYEQKLNEFKELVDKSCELKDGDVPVFSNDDIARAHGMGVDLEEK